MKAVLLCTSDYANLSYTLAQCLNKVGIKAVALKTIKHQFGYINEAKITHVPMMKREVESADIVIFMHSDFIRTGAKLDNKIVAVTHTGTRYRRNASKYNKIFNRICHIAFTCGDSLNLGAKNEILFPPPIDTGYLTPDYEPPIPGKILVGHYPSSEKGIGIIREAVSKVNSKNIVLRYSGDTIPWKNNLKRMRQCDVYVGEVLPGLDIFGISALESACLGKIVCNRFLFRDEYEKSVGTCAVHTTNDAAELASKLDQIASLEPETLIRWKQDSRAWVERVHSYEAVGIWMKNIFGTLK